MRPRNVSVFCLLALTCSAAQAAPKPHTAPPLAEPWLATARWTRTDVLAQLDPRASQPPYNKILLEKQVATAITAARQNDLGPTYALKAEQALPYFEKYFADPNETVREAVVDVAAAAHTPEAVNVLTTLVVDPSVGVRATNALYESFDKLSLRRTGGERLKASLLSCLAQEPYYVSSDVVLLTCFPHDIGVLSALTKLRQGYNKDNGKRQSLAPVDALSINLALSELGQPDALDRVRATIKQGDISLLPALLDKLKFVDNQTTLKSLVSLLRDKRYTKSGITTSAEPPALLIPPGQDPREYLRTHPTAPVSGPQTYYYRVCDIALLRLAERTGVDIGIPAVMDGIRRHNPLLQPRNYTDAELALAYRRLSAHFRMPTKR